MILRGSACKLTDNNPPPAQNFALETYGPDSVCLEQFKPWDMLQCTKIRHSTHWGSGCYPVKCVPTVPYMGSESSVNVVIDVHNRSFHCTYPGEKLTVQIMKDGWLYVGFLLCPEDCRFIYNDHVKSHPDGDPEWCYKRSSNFVRLGYSTDSLQCKARFSYLSDPLLLVMNILVIILLSSNICIYF